MKNVRNVAFNALINEHYYYLTILKFAWPVQSRCHNIKSTRNNKIDILILQFQSIPSCLELKL